MESIKAREECTKGLNAHALAVGTLCNEYARLEISIRYMFVKVSRWDNSLMGTIEMINCFDMKQLIKASKIGCIAAGFHRDWAEAFIAALDYIHEHIRLERNRYVHGLWAKDGSIDTATKLALFPKLATDPKTKERYVKPHVSTGVSATEINSLVSDIVETYQYLILISRWIYHPVMEPLPELFPPPPKWPLLHASKETQRQHAKPQAKSQRPPRPSAASTRTV